MLQADDAVVLRSYSERYAVLRRQKDPTPLLGLGRDLFNWLNGSQKWLERSLGNVSGEIQIELRVPAHPNDTEQAFINAPWELLAGGSGFLALERVFAITRRLGVPAAPHAVDHGDLKTVFMAASPLGSSELDYEEEEYAILEATKGLKVELIVEDSGHLDYLAQRLFEHAPIDVVHLSGHGRPTDQGVRLVMEDMGGNSVDVSPDDIRKEFSVNRPPLVIVSTCHSAEQASAAAPLAIALIQQGFDAVVGWGGPVYDHDATEFARALYQQLASGQTLAVAAAEARLAVYQKGQGQETLGRDWHLARVYLGPSGGGRLCAPGAKRRPTTRAIGNREQAHKKFVEARNNPRATKTPHLDVADPDAFVGRRRETQEIMRCFREGSHAGILIQGQGNLGKSSLAWRVHDRLRSQHYEHVLIYGPPDASFVLEQVIEKCPPEMQTGLAATWRQPVADHPASLKLALQALLTGPLADKPVLLILDDLEQALETPASGQVHTPVAAEWVAPLRAIIEAFDATLGQTQSRLLITSRYTFELKDAHGRDLAGKLLTISLQPMELRTRAKQQRARLRVGQKTNLDAATLKLLERCQSASVGNPGFQDVLTGIVLEDAEAGERALDEVEAYLKDGSKPEDTETAAFLNDLVIATLLDTALSQEEQTFLKVASLFALPVPESALAAVATEVGITVVSSHIARLSGLSLLDRPLDPATGERYHLVNRLARPELARRAKTTSHVPEPFARIDPGPLPLAEREIAILAKAALPVLKAAENLVRLGPTALELARLAAAAGDAATLDDATSAAIFWLGGKTSAEQQYRLAAWAIDDVLEDLGHTPSTLLLRHAGNCARSAGHAEMSKAWLKRGLDNGADPKAQAALWLEWVDDCLQRGEIAEAEAWLSKARERFEALGDKRHLAITQGQISDILYHRGDLDEALRIRREVVLPAFEALGDTRHSAIAQDKISDILFQRGDLDEALRIRREVVLPAFEALGDTR
ncbi:MAG: CHAT domain-containing protein, partial [Anaerolineae bacterium]|nr:CHAT domain-containing protein [Anaerolineae bacterium]